MLGLPTRVTLMMGDGGFEYILFRETIKVLIMESKNKLKPQEVRIISDTEWLDIEELEEMPSFEFKMPSPVKKDSKIEVWNPKKSKSRVKELF